MPLASGRRKSACEWRWVPLGRRSFDWSSAESWAGGGIVLGLLGAWAVSRGVAGLLFEVSAHDPLTFAVTALALAGVAGMACAVPASRATHIDPVIALRGD
jgi:ABC-type lipoprotein release transport system permease subunit